MQASEKKTVVIVGEAGAVSTVVIALVKGGYAVECITDAREILRRIARPQRLCDVVVITPKVSGMRPEKLLLEMTEAGSGSERKAKVPVVMVADGAQERMQAQLVVYAGSEPGMITAAVGEVLRQCQSERH